MSHYRWSRRLGATALSALMLGSLGACSGGSSNEVAQPGNDSGFPSLPSKVVADADGVLSAQIRRTTGGVPHIKADNLESAGFGAGYAQAQDNVCIIADGILKALGERSKFYGPGEENANVISDFSYKALDLLAKAEAEYDGLSPESRALIGGFAAGYNRYVADTDPSDLPPKCAGQPWVREITPQELYAYYGVVARYASGGQFATGATFMAEPSGAGSDAGMAIAASENEELAERILASIDLDDIKINLNDMPMASNGWGIGKEMSESGRGALLANPHFPYTGARRFYQAHITVPGALDFNGAGLIGFVMPQIGFNEHLGWTHTVTTSQRFTLYQLQLKSGDDLIYMKDGQEKPIIEKKIQVEVDMGAPQPVVLERTMYFSEYGPMLAGHLIDENLPEWGGLGMAGKPVAYTYRDANAGTADQAIDQWLRMARSSSVDEFKSAFGECGSVMWVNTIYADDQGNALYLDASAVPNLSKETLTALQTDPFRGMFAAAGLTILDGSTSRDDWVEGKCEGRVPFAQAPKLQRTDYVQNSNDSYWATNPDELLTGYSPLYGSTGTPLSDRTRMGLYMLQHPTDPGLSTVRPAGADGKFSAQDIMNALYSNRAYLAETLLDELLARCDAVNTELVNTANGTRSVAAGCTALKGWDGVYDLHSRGAHTFRLFAEQYQDSLSEDYYTVAFDPKDPANTPRAPKEAAADLASDPMLVALAEALEILDAADLAYDAPLKDVQRVRLSTGVPPNGIPEPLGTIPWHGPQSSPEGGFNVVRPYNGAVDEDTRFPRVAPSEVLGGTGLSKALGEGWWVAYGTSWHFGLEFTDQGPQAYGLLSYSQSTDETSEHFDDQQQMYSAKQYRKLLFKESEIAADPALDTTMVESE